MKESNRERKGEIKYNISLNEEQRQAKQLIIDNQITIVTGVAGTGKSLVGAITALDFLNKKECDKILEHELQLRLEKVWGICLEN